MKNVWMKIAAVMLVCVMGVGMCFPTLADEIPTEDPQIEEIVAETPAEEMTAPEEEPVMVETVEETPVEEGAEIVAEEPVEVETSSEDEGVEETPAEEIPAEEIPAEEIPVVEEIAEEPADEEQTKVEIDYSAMQVIVRTNFENVIMPGDVIELEGVLIGFDGLEYTVQWQYDDGSGWQDVEGANELTYSFGADEENLNYQWRLMVTL